MLDVGDFIFVAMNKIVEQGIGFSFVVFVIVGVDGVLDAGEKLMVLVELGEFAVDAFGELVDELFEFDFDDGKILDHVFAFFFGFQGVDFLLCNQPVFFGLKDGGTSFCDGIARLVSVVLQMKDAGREIGLGIPFGKVWGVLHDAASASFVFVQGEIDGTEKLDDNTVGLVKVSKIADKGQEYVQFFGVDRK